MTSRADVADSLVTNSTRKTVRYGRTDLGHNIRSQYASTINNDTNISQGVGYGNDSSNNDNGYGNCIR
jgi:hypothetical protein